MKLVTSHQVRRPLLVLQWTLRPSLSNTMMIPWPFDLLGKSQGLKITKSPLLIGSSS